MLLLARCDQLHLLGMSEAQMFRVNVGIIVLDASGRVLAFERAPRPKDPRFNRTGQWQLPQGGVEIGEEPAEAWPRELEEETNLSVDDVTLLGEYPGWLIYEYPASVRRFPSVRGQAQKWFIVRAREGVEPDPVAAAHRHGHDPEFSDHKWIPMPELVAEVWEVKRPIYERLAAFMRERGYC